MKKVSKGNENISTLVLSSHFFVKWKLDSMENVILVLLCWKIVGTFLCVGNFGCSWSQSSMRGKNRDLLWNRRLILRYQISEAFVLTTHVLEVWLAGFHTYFVSSGDSFSQQKIYFAFLLSQTRLGVRLFWIELIKTYTEWFSRKYVCRECVQHIWLSIVQW